jgi:large subunit ribosomal protein L23
MTLNSLLKPIISEKSMRLAQAGQFTFALRAGTTKAAAKQAIETLFSVNVTRLNFVRQKGKVRRQGKKRLLTQQPAKKKVIATLKSGQSIKYFELPEKKAKKKAKKEKK